MPTDNRTLVQKAELLVSDFSSAGELQPKQADKFIQLAIKEPVLLQHATVTPMTNFKEERDKMRFASRVLRAGTEAQALPSAEWATPALGMVQLDAQLFKAEVRLSDEVLEDQIERGTFQQTIMQQLARAIGRDMEWVTINGDTGSADPVLAKLDGVLKQTTSNIVNAASAKLTKTVLRDMHRTMPDEFARDQTLMYFSNRQAVTDYRDSLSDRATGFGDVILNTKSDVNWSGMPVKPVVEFPVSGGNTQALHGNMAGIVVGILRKMRVKVQEDISAGVILIVATVRFDAKLTEELAFVKATNVVGE